MRNDVPRGQDAAGLGDAVALQCEDASFEQGLAADDSRFPGFALFSILHACS
jgi:hypothetical protein